MDYRRAREHLEYALCTYPPLEQPGPREPMVDRMRLGSQADAYWRLCGDLDGLPPLQGEFVAAVCAETALLYADRGFPWGATWAGVQALLRVTYPSWVRQHHVELQLRERALRAVRCSELDRRLGYDFLVSEGGAMYGLKVGMRSRRALRLDAAKAARSPADRNVPAYELRLDRGKALRCGDFELHPPEDIERFVAWMARLRGERPPRPVTPQPVTQRALFGSLR